jgi:type II secretory pathway component PulJ
MKYCWSGRPADASPNTFRLRDDTRGVCLAELMVSLAIGAVVLAASLETLNRLETHAAQQHRALTQQQDLRVGLEVFEQEVRLATSDSITTAAPEEFHFLANINGQQTLTTSAVAAGQSVLPVRDGSGWGEGKTVTLCSPQVCETHRLARIGQRSQLTLSEPVGQTIAAGAAVEMRNRVVYYAKQDEDGAIKLMRMVDGGASTLAGDLELVRFSYWDERGRAALVPAQIRRVVVELTRRHAKHKVTAEVGLRS